MSTRFPHLPNLTDAGIDAACRQIETELRSPQFAAAMDELADLFASVLPNENDDDDCGVTL